MNPAVKLILALLLAFFLVCTLVAVAKYLFAYAVIAVVIVAGLALLGRYLIGLERKEAPAEPPRVERKLERAAERDLKHMERRNRQR